METTRQKKVARQIQKDLAEIILKNNNLIYPKSLISVSKVRMSPDLSYAKVYLSVFPLKDQKTFLKSINRFSFQIKNAVITSYPGCSSLPGLTTKIPLLPA